MNAARSEHALDHVVAVMFENRSFDNLLGRLYEPGEVASFEGVIGKDCRTRSRNGPRIAPGRAQCPTASPRT
jgi:phospholipase C